LRKFASISSDGELRAILNLRASASPEYVKYDARRWRDTDEPEAIAAVGAAHRVAVRERVGRFGLPWRAWSIIGCIRRGSRARTVTTEP
jgi:hypothetical protein